MSKENPPFKKVTPSPSYKEVAQQIQHAIIDQHLKPGDKLPRQNELMETFQVSKFTLIAAFRFLEQAGLVYTKHGATGGTFVSEMNTEPFTESLKLLISMKKITLDELAEFRQPIEGWAAYLAAKKRDSKDLDRMRQLLNTMEQLLASSHSREEMIHMDQAFHLAIAEASHNRLCLALMETINQCFLPEAFSYIPPGNEARIYADHIRIYRAIHAKKASLAEKGVKNHITYFKKLIIQNFRKEYPET